MVVKISIDIVGKSDAILNIRKNLVNQIENNPDFVSISWSSSIDKDKKEL